MRYDRIGSFAMSTDPTGPARADSDSADWRCIKTEEGFLRCYGYLAKPGVFGYSDPEGNEWTEWKPAEELHSPETLASFGLMVVTDDHPPEMVNIENVSQYQKGHIGDQIEPDQEGKIKAQILITDADLVSKIESGKQELSVGYRIAADETPGTSPEGVPYDVKQTEIRGNHLAVVDQGRAGPTCRLTLDSAKIAFGRGIIAMKRKDELDPMEALRVENEALKAKVEEQAAKLAELGTAPPAADSMTEGELPMDADACAEPAPAPKMDSLMGRIASLEAQLKNATKLDSKRIDARVALVERARQVLGATCKTDGLSDSAIKKSVVLAIQPELKGKLDHASEGYIDGAYESSLSIHQSKLDNELGRLVFDSSTGHGAEEKFDFDGAVAARFKR